MEQLEAERQLRVEPGQLRQLVLPAGLADGLADGLVAGLLVIR